MRKYGLRAVDAVHRGAWLFRFMASDYGPAFTMDASKARYWLDVAAAWKEARHLNNRRLGGAGFWSVPIEVEVVELDVGAGDGA